ncbi:hypothetical protein RhiXN_04771 [Rhizoctonia solani]|uniref:Uncharacterized protein n=1 Tax=Rhizoctonia solani TaxID=456999 RepID=A0A8H8ST70_9AGAM|nr:uncharacterized protein RhiXN_04771 [Rhizoctonia solani]QRW16769.1 hypothetical protein RhiXN_04771 [Rhizoctonia solani]
MSTPQSASTKRTKRPRGLLASRKTTGNPAESEPAAKRARGEDTPPQDPEELKLQDWHDLEELFENALDALYGPNWTSAIPLIRGVLHECARMVTVYNDPTLIYSPLEPETQVGPEKAPASAFYTIYASAWFIMSTFARVTLLLTEDEPEEALEYLLSALSACEKGEQALDVRKQTKAWDPFRLGDEPRSLKMVPLMLERTSRLGPSAALARAFEHLTYDESKDERFSEESLPFSILKMPKFLHQVEEMSVPEELRVQVILVLGQINLAIGSSIAEKFEEDSNAEDGTGVKDLKLEKLRLGH